jgi:OmpA-OmpF porin, OOP family
MLRLLTLLVALGVSLAAAPRIEQNHIVLDAAFTFAGDSAEPAGATDEAVRQLAAFLAEKPALTLVRLEGHAPDQALSEQRALVIARLLVAAGIACERLLPVGFGATKPVAAPREAAANTRLEIHVAALRGRLIGGMPADGGGQVAGKPCAP